MTKEILLALKGSEGSYLPTVVTLGLTSSSFLFFMIFEHISLWPLIAPAQVCELEVVKEAWVTALVVTGS